MRASGAGSAGRFVRYAVIAGALFAATPCWAETATADSICSLEPPSGTLPDEATLKDRTARIERAMTRGGLPFTLQSAVAIETPDDDAPAGRGSTKPSDRSLAAYCAAAGEAARTLSEGNQFQAHAYLVSAFRRAERADLSRLGARSAYRLGLVHVSDPASLSGAAAVQFADGMGAGNGAEQACAMLRGLDVSQMFGKAFSAVALECANGRALAAGDADLAALSSLRLARLATTSPDLLVAAPDARAYGGRVALDAFAPARAIADPIRSATVTGRLVETALDAGITDYAALDKAIGDMDVAGAGDPGVAAFATALRGRLALATGADATGYFQRAIELESQRALPSRLPDWLLLLAATDRAHRYEHVASAYRALEAVRPFLPAIDPLSQESTFALRMQAVYEAAVDAELARATGDDPARIAKAQDILESYRQAEIQDLFGADCAPPATPFTAADLRGQEIVLYPVLLEDRVELLYASAARGDGSPRFHRLPPRSVGRGEVEQAVAALLSLGERDHGESWAAASAALYALLIAPIEPQLGEGTTLIIVPDSGLRAVPFAALRDADGRYLVQRARLTVAPALAYLQPGDATITRSPDVVAAALSQEVVVSGGAFSKLQFTVPEARAVADVEQGASGSGRVIVNFSKAELERVLVREPVDILHLATHAAFNGGSDRSFIVASDQLVRLSELRDLIVARRTRGSGLDLLVLSACETAVGDDEAAMGLAGAAVQAGAVSALASLWQVDDIGTAQLMTTFYQGLRAGKSKAAALREAQIAMITGDPAQADPWIWSAFTMLGGWR
ncbi:CHAT domain-containing protein [Novosphingobium aquimarinum]|uniref:CHAT domain-containing protein n=1 Tax=Novosphingobium aquimarinum TaxID=2682494 RepID=UPI0018DD68B1|nr:CHAT domain-containing protein [Novosphingobium aquimarinum]